MVLFQKQTTQAKGKYLKKQIDFKVILYLFLLVAFSKNLFGEELKIKIDNYLRGLDSFSSNFIQSDGLFLEEGLIYIKNDMIRLDYINPRRTLKLKKDKGVYINHDLEEEEFFSTKKNIIKTFYDIFLYKDFFYSLTPKINNKEIIFEKNITIDSNNTHIKVFFENDPLVLRKVIAKTENSLISISFYNHTYDEFFEEGYFSFVPIYPN